MTKFKTFVSMVIMAALAANTAQALTMRDIINGQSGQVLGASTPGLVQTKMAPDANPMPSISFTSANTAGNLAVGIFTIVGDQTTTFSVSDTEGNNWRKAGCNFSASNGGYTICLMYAENIKAGANTVSSNFNGDGRGVIAEFSGLALSGSLDGTNSSNGSGAAMDSGAFTTTNSTDLLIGGFMAFGGTPTPAANWSSLASTDQYNWTEYRNVNATGSYSASATVSGSDWLAVGAAFKASSGGGASDTQAPTIPTNLSASALSSSAINLSWTASTDNVGVTGYKIFRGGVQIGTSATTNYSDSGLSASTNYSYTVSANDAAGNNSSQSSSASATTQAQSSDTTAPSVPTNLSASALSSSAINLSWTASTDNVGVTGYKIFRGGVLVGTSGSASYSDSGLTASTQYTYNVSANDAAGNSSSQSTSASATTQAGSVGASGNIYIAQTAAGSANGSSCANAYAVSFFNTAANWGSGTGKIGPGVMVHLCGTFTGTANSTMLTFQGSGTSGNPITLLFEPGAILTAPYWGTTNGAINVSNCSWIVIDGGGVGGTNGIIQASANGTAFANQQDDLGIVVTNTSHVTVQNIWIKDLYIRTANTSGGDGFDSSGITGTDATDILVAYSKFTNMKEGFGVAFDRAGQNWESSHNYFFAVEAPNILATGTDGAVWHNALIHDCNFAGGVDQWDDPTDNSFHHDGMLHFWAQDNTQTAHIYGVKVYNNYIHGVWGNDAAYYSATNGSHITAYLYPEQMGGDITIFNNVFDLSGGDPRYMSPDNGIIFCKSTNSPGMVCNIYNNTFIGPAGNTTYDVALETDSGGGHIFKNNVVENLGLAYYLGGGANSSITADNNLYYQIGDSGWNFGSFAGWQSSGQDAHAKNGISPLLNASFVPQSGSAAISAGANLTSLGVVALDSDFAGVARPASAAWDIGAYQASSGGGSGDVTPPTASITSPTSGATVSNVVSVSATASDNVGVSRVEFYLDNVLQQTDTTSPYTWSWNTAGSSNGSHALTAKAYDAAGNVGTSPTVAVTVSNSTPDTTAPTVSITAPSAGTVSGSITFSATAADPTNGTQIVSGLKLITLSVDGSTFATSTASPISRSFDTTTLVNGSHTLTAQAQDNAGNLSTVASVAVTVNNVAPQKHPRLIVLTSLEGIAAIPSNQAITATIVSPSNGATLETQSNLTPNVSKQYTISFLSADPQIVNIRIKVNGYLSQLLSNIDTTVNSGVALSVPQLLSADLNNDNTINTLDYSTMNANWLKPGSTIVTGDLNGDGLVNSLDFAILKNNFGKSGG